MNHPTSQADELLLLAKEAMNDGDRHEAIAILRKATREAPLRRDIRLYLASVLDSESIETEPQSCEMESVAVSTSDRVSEVARNAFNSVASHTANATAATLKLSNMLNQGLKNLTTSDSVFHRQPPPEAPPAPGLLPPPSDTSRVMRSTASPMAASTGNMRSEIESIMEVMDSDPELTGAKSYRQLYPHDLDAELAEKVPAAPAKRPSRERTQRGQDLEDAIGSVAESLVGSWKTLGWKRFSYSLAFVCLAGYTILACTITYKRFFSATPGTTRPQARVRANPVTAVAPPQLDLNSQSADNTLLGSAMANINLGNHEEAIRQLTTLVSTYPGRASAQTATSELARLLESRAAKQLVANKIAESVSSYRQVAALVPDSTDYQLRLANALFYAGTIVKDGREKTNLNESSKLLQSILQKDPAHLQAHSLSASVYEALDKKDLARKNWERVKVLAPANSDLRKNADKQLAERRS